MNEPKRAPKIVDFLNHEDDHACVLLASLGFSTSYICQRTELSPSQVTYRIKKANLTKESGMSRSDFRNGNSPFANLVLKSARVIADRELIKRLRSMSGEEHKS